MGSVKFVRSQVRTTCLALNGSKIKHVSEMKDDIRLCASAFSVVTVTVFPSWSRLPSRCMCVALDSWVPSHFTSFEMFFSWGRMWIAFCGWQNWNPTFVFDTNLIRCTRTKQHWFTCRWCIGTSVWGRQVSCDNGSPVRLCTTSLLHLYSCLCWLLRRILLWVMSLWEQFPS
jgi:hypothetical protein